MEMGGLYVSALLGPLPGIDLDSDATLIPHRIHKQEPSLRVHCLLLVSLFQKTQAN